MIEWKDTSSYSQSDKERIPTSWTAHTSEFRVSIHRHIYYDKNTWLVSCHELGIEKNVLKNQDIKLAKNEAIEVVKARLAVLVKAGKELK